LSALGSAAGSAISTGAFNKMPGIPSTNTFTPKNITGLAQVDRNVLSQSGNYGLRSVKKNTSIFPPKTPRFSWEQ